MVEEILLKFNPAYPLLGFAIGFVPVAILIYFGETAFFIAMAVLIVGMSIVGVVLVRAALKSLAEAKALLEEMRQLRKKRGSIEDSKGR